VNKFIVNNLSGQDVTIKGQLIPTGTSFTVPDGDILAWCQDAYLNFLLCQNRVTISAFDTDMGEASPWWVANISRGTFTYN